MKRLFGKIAVARGFLSDDQLQAVLAQFGREQQVETARRRRLGEIAVALGFVTDQQVQELLALQRALMEAEDTADETLPGAVGPMPGGPWPSPTLPALIEAAVRAGASDLHVHAGQPPFVRRAGRLVRSQGGAPDPDQVASELRHLLDDEQLLRLDSDGQVDLCVPYRGGYRLRANIFYERLGLCGAFRVIPPKIPTLGDLRLPSQVAALTTFPQGLVLVSGPAGCGKTTSLAALVELINLERKHHILCIEDPIEFVHRPRQATITQRALGDHTASTDSALRAALREDPDVIVIGELRDADTIHLALSAAETGHLVLSSLHTTGIEGTVSRILDAFSGGQEAQVRAMLAESLRGVLTQRLVQAVGGGRVPVVELLFNTLAVGNCIRDRKLHQLPSLMQTGRKANMITREESAKDLLTHQLISRETYDRVLAHGAGA